MAVVFGSLRPLLKKKNIYIYIYICQSCRNIATQCMSVRWVFIRSQFSNFILQNISTAPTTNIIILRLATIIGTAEIIMLTFFFFVFQKNNSVSRRNRGLTDGSTIWRIRNGVRSVCQSLYYIP